jgi:branched-chain amino acid transport system permease protein
MLCPVVVRGAILIMVLLHFYPKREWKAMRDLSGPCDGGLVGININQVISVAFMIGSSLAVAGIMVTLYYGAVTFHGISRHQGLYRGGVGGIGSIPALALGGFMLGLIENFGASYISSVYKDAFAFVVLIIVLIIRPAGLLGDKAMDKV